MGVYELFNLLLPLVFLFFVFCFLLFIGEDRSS